MAQPPAMGPIAHLGMAADTSLTPAVATEEYEFLTEGLATEREIIHTPGVRGTRLRPVERLKLGRQTPAGVISMQPSYLDLANLLPRCIGALSGITYTVSDTVPVAFQVITDRVTKVLTYCGCRMGTVKFHAGPGQPLTMDMTIDALTETQASAGSTNWSGIGALALAAPFIFEEAVLNLAGGPVQIIAFETTIDWHLKKDRWVNSLTRTDLPSMDLEIQTSFIVPYTSDTSALYDNGGVVTGTAGNINFSTGGVGGGGAGVNFKLTYGALVFPARKSPVVHNKDEITLTLAGEAYRTGTTSPLVAQLDITP